MVKEDTRVIHTREKKKKGIIVCEKDVNGMSEKTNQNSDQCWEKDLNKVSGKIRCASTLF